MGFWNILRTIFYIIVICFKAPLMIVEFYIKRRRAIYRFKRELISSGIPRREAEKLANIYPLKLGELMEVIKNSSNHKMASNISI